MRIRPAQPQDVAQLLAIYTPYVEQTSITFETEVPSISDFQKRMKDIQRFFPYLVAEVAGEVIGYAYAHPYYGRAAYAWTAELSIYVDRNKRQTGVGTALYEQLEESLASQNLVNCLACISLPNDGSIAFHQKRGYQQVAHFDRVGYKFGQWHDVVWLQKRLQETDSPDPLVYKQD